MKSLFKIISRYSLIAGGIIFIILLSNVMVAGYLGYQSMKAQDSSYVGNVRETVDAVSKKLSKKNGSYALSEKGRQILEDTNFVWAMAINQEGKVVWDWKLPKEIPRKYSLNDVATFSRWYLCDYPVRVWKQEDLLMVYAYPKDSFVVLRMYYTVDSIKNFPKYIKVFLLANVFVIVLFILLLGYRFYRALRPISEGIDALSEKKLIHLREKGMVGDLARKINLTSRLLEDQDKKLKLRDETRTDWIAGVSHDIRTPLTLIMGYAQRISYSDKLSREERELAASIQRQSVIIKQLIEDLNLTSKLSYNQTPLHLLRHSPATILRESVADIYNSGLDESYEISVFISEKAEKTVVLLDEKLLKRAIRNILGNSIRHNPQGCKIEVSLSVQGEFLRYFFRDSGAGIGEEIVRELNQDNFSLLEHRAKTEEKIQKPHIMGLRLVKQIALLHGGELRFLKRETGRYDSEIWIALSS